MSTMDVVSAVLHLLSAGLWTGAVVFVAWSLLPLARSGEIQPGPFRAAIGKLRTLSRGSALVLFLTGGHMAGTGYTVESLTGTTRGHLVLGMVALWFVLIALVEVGSGRLTGGLDAGKLREPARNATRIFQAAALVSLLLLVLAGLLAGDVV